MKECNVNPKLESIKIRNQYESLSILKKKFEIFKPTIFTIYSTYGPIFPSIINSTEEIIHKVIDIQSLEPLLDEVITLINVMFLPVEMIVLNSRQITKDEDNHKYNKMIQHSIANYAKAFIHKYNMIYYNKKIKNNTNINTEKSINISQSDVRTESCINKQSKTDNIKCKEKEEIDPKYKLKKGKMYIKTLPLIIADFIQCNKDIIIKDLEKKKSNEIIKKIEKDSSIDIIQIDHKYSKLSQSLDSYKNILIKAENENNPNVPYIKQIVSMLSNKKKMIDKIAWKQAILPPSKSNSPHLHLHTDQSRPSLNLSNNTSRITQNNKENSLINIFDFYSNQHNYTRANCLFGDLQSKSNYQDITEFSKFCSDFQIEITKEILLQLFNKNTSILGRMQYHEFKLVLDKMSFEMYTNRIINLSKRAKKLKSHLASIKKKPFTIKANFIDKTALMSVDEDNNDYNSHRVTHDQAVALCMTKKQQMKEELYSIESDLLSLKGLSEAEIKERFYAYLGIDHSNTYRSKMKKLGKSIILDKLPRNMPKTSTVMTSNHQQQLSPISGHFIRETLNEYNGDNNPTVNSDGINNNDIISEHTQEEEEKQKLIDTIDYPQLPMITNESNNNNAQSINKKSPVYSVIGKPKLEYIDKNGHYQPYPSTSLSKSSLFNHRALTNPNESHKKNQEKKHKNNSFREPRNSYIPSMDYSKQIKTKKNNVINVQNQLTNQINETVKMIQNIEYSDNKSKVYPLLSKMATK